MGKSKKKCAILESQLFDQGLWLTLTDFSNSKICEIYVKVTR